MTVLKPILRHAKLASIPLHFCFSTESNIHYDTLLTAALNYHNVTDGNEYSYCWMLMCINKVTSMTIMFLNKGQFKENHVRHRMYACIYYIMIVLMLHPTHPLLHSLEQIIKRNYQMKCWLKMNPVDVII